MGGRLDVQPRAHPDKTMTDAKVRNPIADR
jgi:hypothetical protein